MSSTDEFADTISFEAVAPEPAHTAAAPGSSVASGPAQPSSSTMITCPECGTVSMVTLNARESRDFCRNCDYPLFWTPTTIVLDSSGAGDESLRRLPGTVGRATLASLACPHCNEPNAVTAELCVRCGRSLHPVAEPPPPPRVYVPPPPLPAPVVEEAPKGTPWWVWLIACVGLAMAIALVTILILRELS